MEKCKECVSIVKNLSLNQPDFQPTEKRTAWHDFDVAVLQITQIDTI